MKLISIRIMQSHRNDINLLEFAWKKSWNQNKWIICGGFLLFRITVLRTNALSWENSKFALSPLSPQTMRSKQAKIIWFKKLRNFNLILKELRFSKSLDKIETFANFWSPLPLFAICLSYVPGSIKKGSKT